MLHNIQIIAAVVSLPFLLYGAYYTVIAIIGLRKAKTYNYASPQKRFAIVVPARNEAEVIADMVEGLRQQNYPKHLYEIIVAPNNCTDNTEELAREKGARIFIPSGVVKSKGEVLTQIVDEIVLKEIFDAMCVFDADCFASPTFLQKMNNALCAGANAAQCFRDSVNPHSSTVSGWYAIGYWMLNRFYNAPRAALGLSALVSGNGFAISSKLLKKLGGWHTVTMTEDYEVSAQIAIAGERVHYVSDTAVYNDLPDSFTMSWKQRRRWVTGTLEGLKIYAPDLIKNAAENKNTISLDMFLTFLSPVIGLLSFIVSIFASTLWGIVPMLFMLISSAVCGIIGAAAAALFTSLLKNQSVKGMGGAIISFCIFLVSQMAITVSCLFNMQKTWDPIVTHNTKNIAA